MEALRNSCAVRASLMWLYLCGFMFVKMRDHHIPGIVGLLS